MIEINPTETTYAIILNAQTGKADFTCILAGQNLACGQPCVIYSEDHQAVLDCVYSSYQTEESNGLHYAVEGIKRTETEIRSAIQAGVTAGSISQAGTF